MTRPAPVSWRLPASAAAAATASPASTIGSARPAACAAPSAIRVRSIVGQSVTRVPTTVSPIQPSRFTIAWATTTRAWTPSLRPWAIVTPSATPSGSTAPAAT